MTQSTYKLGAIGYLVVLVGIGLANRVVEFITDYAWFNEVDLLSIFQVSFFSTWGLTLVAGILSAALILVNLRWAQKNTRTATLMLEEEDDVIGTLQLKAWRVPSRGLLRAASWIGVVGIALWAGSQWDVFLKAWHSVPFNLVDPVLHRDIGFYVFSLPLYDALFAFARSVFVLSTLVVVGTYLIEGSLFVTPRGVKIIPAVRSHLFLLAGFGAVLAACHFQLKIYDMMNVQRTVAPGPGYAMLHAYLPILRVLPWVAMATAVLCWANLFTRTGSWALIGMALVIAGSIGASAYRELMQRFFVSPNEIVQETPYIEHAIRSTRQAYGLDQIQELEFDPTDNLTQQALRRNDLTIKNIRLWEHAPLLRTYGQLQEIRTYYDFMDVDNDRYRINGELRQVMLSPRELNAASLPSRIWINEHLTYTHGYGLTLGPVNRISPEGLPEFFIKDIPPQTTSDFKVTRPEIYYGESKADYAIVRTQSKEFDYPSGDENIYSRYEGSGGVPLRNFFGKLLFALRFKELKILLSGDITSESKILYHRGLQERLAKAAPFLRFDQDPYLVISKDGKLFWMVDAYTSSDRYPYSAELRGVGNYIRNSVKAVVDAYNGSLSFYVSDDHDPIIRTYANIFPGVFKPLSEMSDDLKSHIRYPQDLFSIQAYLYATYHMTDPQVFYNKEDLWKIPEKTGGQQRMAPYYTVMKLASVGQQEEFILMVPFTPARKENMIAWLAARCDAPNYGKLLVYNFPKQKLVYGPQQIESRIDQDAVISQQLTLWNQGGSKVLRGNLLVIPVENSLLYVMPLYLEATGGGLPELKRVIVAFGNSIVMEETLEASLGRIFSGRADSSRTAAAPPVPGATAQNIGRQAQMHFERAQSYLRAGDWAGYGAEMKNVESVLKRLTELR